MNLSEAVAMYVSHKRVNGVAFPKGESSFNGLCRWVGDSPVSEIQPQQVLSFLGGRNTSNATFRVNYSQIKCLFEFLVVRGLVNEFAMPPNRPFTRPTFTPYIYTKDEIRRLLKAARYKSRSAFCQLNASQMMRALLITLYATGALVGELIALKSADIDLDSGRMVLRSDRCGRFRHLPLSRDLLTELHKYARWKKRMSIESEFFFSKNDGTQLVSHSLDKIFQRIRRRAAVVRTDGSTYQPRMHDLRSTFAVHRITSWVRNNADMNKMLPALAAYMGQSGLTSTERYFHLTPERFRKHLQKLSPAKARKRWAADARLMAFVSSL